MTALYVHLVILWAAFFGMVAFRQNALITRRSKQLGALVFAVIIVEAAAFKPQDEAHLSQGTLSEAADRVPSPRAPSNVARNHKPRAAPRAERPH